MKRYIIINICSRWDLFKTSGYWTPLVRETIRSWWQHVSSIDHGWPVRTSYVGVMTPTTNDSRRSAYTMSWLTPAVYRDTIRLHSPRHAGSLETYIRWANGGKRQNFSSWASGNSKHSFLQVRLQRLRHYRILITYSLPTAQYWYRNSYLNLCERLNEIVLGKLLHTMFSFWS